MATGEAAAPTVLPSFPLPPPFFKLYADDDGNGTRPLPPDPPSLPQGPFMLFGQPFDPSEPQVPPLQGRRLYEHLPDGSIDFKGELSRLMRELMFVYMEVLRALVENPNIYASPLNTLNQLLANIQHLLNMLRPVQARASLEYVLKLQVQDKLDALASLKAQMDAIDKAVAAAVKELSEHCVPNSVNAVEGEALLPS